MIGLPPSPTIFIVAMVLAICAWLASIALAIGIKSHVPALSHVVGNVFNGWPFWVFNFLSPSKYRLLSCTKRSIAIAAMTTLGLSMAMLLLVVFRFAASGGSL